jgi:hypothetical protein
MSRRDIAFIASRTLALLLLTWAFTEATYLPERVLALSHYSGLRSVLASSDYLSRYYQSILIFNLLRLFAFVGAAVVLWRFGPRVERLFSNGSTGEQ